MKQDPNQPVANQLEIVHAVPGRVRLRLLGEDSEENLEADGVSIACQRLETLGEIAQHLRQQEGVESVQVKETTSSMVVTFDPNTLSTSQLKESLSPFNLSSISPNSKAKDLQSSGEKLFSQLLSLIPILLGWLVVKRFNLSGWKAIVTYLLATGVIGEVMEQAQLELSPLLTDESLSKNKVEPKKILPLKDEKELDFKIAHHIPGRIRLSIPKIAKDQNYAQKLEHLLEQDERITAIRINSTTGSVVVHYLEEALREVSEEELTLILSNWMELIDSAIVLETSGRFTAEAQNTVERDGHLS